MSGNLAASDSKYSALYEEHVLDFKEVMATSSNVGNPYIDWLTFNLGCYLLAASAQGRLPANLQGIWAKDTLNPWSAGEFFWMVGTQLLTTACSIVLCPLYQTIMVSFMQWLQEKNGITYVSS